MWLIQNSYGEGNVLLKIDSMDDLLCQVFVTVRELHRKLREHLDKPCPWYWSSSSSSVLGYSTSPASSEQTLDQANIIIILTEDTNTHPHMMTWHLRLGSKSWATKCHIHGIKEKEVLNLKTQVPPSCCNAETSQVLQKEITEEIKTVLIYNSSPFCIQW